jgi:hypothetical protein
MNNMVSWESDGTSGLFEDEQSLGTNYIQKIMRERLFFIKKKEQKKTQDKIKLAKRLDHKMLHNVEMCNVNMGITNMVMSENRSKALKSAEESTHPCEFLYII